MSMKYPHPPPRDEEATASPPPPPHRRPRGFASSTAPAHSAGATPPRRRGEREREREKERTKLRERHRRAITSRMLAGLRQHGNFPLPARADMNDVLAALARAAGWTVHPDGTTFRSSPQALSPPPQLGTFHVTSVETPTLTNTLNSYAIGTPLDSQASVLHTDDSLSPSSLDSVVVAEQSIKNENYGNSSSANSLHSMDNDQLLRSSTVLAGDYTRTPYIPVYASLPMGIINSHCQLVEPEAVRTELRHLKSLNVDGVVVDCWWGIVEAWTPRKYEWSGYRDLFGIIKEFKLKVQVLLSFHGSGEAGSGDALISLPKWIMEIAKENQDIFFTDREGRRNTECLSWGIDKERVLRGRTGIEVYFDFMRSFHMEFRNLSEEGLISAIEIGLGASGELRYPSCPERMGWRYPGIGEFQCYDRYMQKNLRQSALSRGHLFWARGPDNAGYYNSRPHETGFFRDGGDYDSYYGRFFLKWYSGVLIDHVDQVLSLATLAFDGAEIVVKIPSIYWWYRTASHAAELTAGFYNPTNRDGYSPVFKMLKKHSVVLKLVCYGPEFTVQENDEASADPEGLTWQVMNVAWDHGLSLCIESALPCLDGEMYARILDTTKPRNDPDRHHASFFVYRLQHPLLQRDVCFSELCSFVKCMHGEAPQNGEG
ncbi:beta-amylase 8-like isoform X2 [Phragmites australis]|uniref:beta-amylase 8-like isoform X2 n=1 Tax=Phragmites australis TaxID=29695 RepID=UPI002D79FC11|nr:beta-amylase 8-like isoform X2 [Phragmites australis]